MYSALSTSNQGLEDVELDGISSNDPNTDADRRQSIHSSKATSDSVSKQPSESASKLNSTSLQDPVANGNSGQHIWSPGFWRQFPLWGMLALFCCFACIIASIVILVKSDGQPTSSWPISPTVYLAISTAILNTLAQYAFNQGATIAWWHKALRGGTVQELHHHWAYASGFWSALYLPHSRGFNLVALGSAAVAILVIDQPLLQRASSVVSASRTSVVNITAPIAPEIPWGFTGQGPQVIPVMTAPMISVFNAYNTQSPIDSTFLGCSGTCTGYVEAGGLAAQCNAISGPVWYNFEEYTSDISDETSYNYGNISFSPFSVNFDLLPINNTRPTQIIMKVAYTANATYSTCSGIRTERTCFLAPATLRYPVSISGNTLTLGNIFSDGTIQSFQPPVPNDGYHQDIDGGPLSLGIGFWTLGGIFVAAKSLFTSNATYYFSNSSITAPNGHGGVTGTGGLSYAFLPDTLSNQFLNLSAPSPIGLTSLGNLTTPTQCDLNWADPTTHILTALNTMAFQLSLSAANFPVRNTSTPPIPQILAMEQTNTINVFHSDYRFLIASTLLSFLFILLILPTFYGWWEIGRPVSMNPIETAKVFDAPLLHGPGSNAPLDKLVNIVGSRGVQLGAVESDTSGQVAGQLKLGHPSEVTRPRKGVAYI